MKKIGEIMQELGFNKDGPEGVKEAFIKHLIKASTGTHVATPSEKRTVQESTNTATLKRPEQLSFEFLKEDPQPSSRKKAVS